MKKQFKTTIQRRDITVLGNPFKFTHDRNCDDPQVDSVIIEWSLNYTFKEWGIEKVEIEIEAFNFSVYTDDYSTDGNPINDLSGQSMYFSKKTDNFEIDFFDEEETIKNGYIGSFDVDFSGSVNKIQIS